MPPAQVLSCIHGPLFLVKRSCLSTTAGSAVQLASPCSGGVRFTLSINVSLGFYGTWITPVVFCAMSHQEPAKTREWRDLTSAEQLQELRVMFKGFR